MKEQPAPLTVVGLHSGTSADGIDAVALELHQDGEVLHARLRGGATHAFGDGPRRRLLAAMPPAQTTAAEICYLDAELGRAFADSAAAALAGWCGGTADLIGVLGQTLYHDVRSDGTVAGSLQLGQPAFVAERVGIPVVADLRARDIAAGGQGAPLAALLDVLLLTGRQGRPAALNLGGIANMTLVPDGAEPVAFDCGPANTVLDALVPVAPPDLPVVCAQNGVDNERQALRRFGNVYGVHVMCPATFLEPGVVQDNSSPISGLLDIGRAVTWDSPSALDVMVTDDHVQSAEHVQTGRLQYKKPFHAELAEVVGGAKKGRTSPQQRTALIFSGLALADVAVAGAIYEGALKAGKGMVLPL